MERVKKYQAAINFLLVLVACAFFALALKYAPDDITPYLYAGAAVYTLLLIMIGYLEKKCRE